MFEVHSHGAFTKKYFGEDRPEMYLTVHASYDNLADAEKCVKRVKAGHTPNTIIIVEV